MRILLQHVRTQLYLRSVGNWTANAFEARDFDDSHQAAAFAREHNIPGVQIAVKFPNSRLDEISPLPSAPQSAKIRPTER